MRKGESIIIKTKNKPLLTQASELGTQGCRISDQERQMSDYEELKVYQKALIFVDRIYELTKDYPKEELYGIVSQLRRAAVSIVCNIAEGSGRYHDKEYIQFLRIARASVFECMALIEISQRRGYLAKDRADSLEKSGEEISKMLNALIKTISKDK